MTEEVSTTTKTTSNGSVKITLEEYNDLVEQAAVKPPIINRTTINKTPEMVSQELRLWGGSLMILGATLFTIGVGLYRAGK